jgi:hypothetical protein
MRVLFAIVALLPLRLAAADFCAVHLTVNTSGGKPANAPVELIDRDGHVEQSFSVHGKLEICDMAFGLHTIRIGSSNCSQYVEIHNIALVYGSPRFINAVWDGCWSQGDGIIIPPSCLARFRVVSTAGIKLGDAEAYWEGKEFHEHADSFGRFFLGMPNGSKSTLVFTAPGFVDQRVGLTCKYYETIEKVVEMQLPKKE